MNCLDCNKEIPAARIEAIGETDYCVNCADKHAAPVVARMIYSHKTAGELFIAQGKHLMVNLPLGFSFGQFLIRLRFE